MKFPKYKKLSKEEEKSKSLDELIKNNLRFVTKCVNDFKTLYDEQVKEDLTHNGVIGLIEAAKKYNPKFDNKFISYAVFYIKKEIRKAIIKHQFIQQSEKNKKKIRKFAIINTLKYHEEKLSNYEDINLENTPYEKNEVIDFCNILHKSLDILDKKEKYVIIHRFGLFGNKKKTLDEISEKIKYTLTGIRNIEVRAMKKIKLNIEKLNWR